MSPNRAWPGIDMEYQQVGLTAKASESWHNLCSRINERATIKGQRGTIWKRQSAAKVTKFTTRTARTKRQFAIVVVRRCTLWNYSKRTWTVINSRTCT